MSLGTKRKVRYLNQKLYKSWQENNSYRLRRKENGIMFNIIGTLEHGTEIHRVTEGTAAWLRHMLLCYFTCIL
jgi:hypothetical protein